MTFLSSAYCALIAGLFLPGLVYGQSPGTDELEKLERRFEALADEVRPSVVSIRVDRRDGSTGWQRYYTGYGTGFVLTADGLILTNEHVTEGASSITVVLFNGSQYDARVVSADPRRDLAVLKVAAEQLKPVEFGHHDDVKQGQFAIAFGNPFGTAKRDGRLAMSFGIVSSLGKDLSHRLDDTDDQDRYYGNLIQTLMPIHPGNSGGPLFDKQGRIIGIIVAVGSEVDHVFGFAIPITDHTRDIINTLMRGERVEYGMLGAVVKDVPRRRGGLRQTGRGIGAWVIAQPEQGTAAAQAGIQENDVIVEFDGTTVQDSDHLVRIVGATPVGREVELRCVREGRIQTVSVVLDKRPLAETPLPQLQLDTFPWRGALFAERSLGNTSTDRNSSARDTELVVITVHRSSPAYQAGLRELDADGRRVVITRVNRQRVRTIDDFHRAIKRSTPFVVLELSDNTRIRVPIK